MTRKSIINSFLWNGALAIFIVVWFDLNLTYLSVGSDFTQDYAAGIALRQGLSPYAPEIGTIAQGCCGVSDIKNFHPPFVAVVFSVISLLPYAAAQLLWGLLGVVAYLFCFVALKKLFVPAHCLLVPVAMLFWFPIIDGSASANYSFAISAGVCGAFLAMRQDKAILAGVLIAIVASLKMYPLLIFAGVVICGYWRTAISALISMIFIYALTLYFVGIEATTFYFTTIVKQNVAEWGLFPANLSITGILMPLFQDGPWSSPLLYSPKIGSILIFLSKLFLACLFIYLLLQKAVRQDLNLLFNLTIVFMVFLSPISWPHGLVLLAMPIFYLIGRSDKYRRKWLLVAVLLIAIPTHPLARYLQAALGSLLLPWWAMLTVKVASLGVLIILCLLLSQLREVKREQAKSGSLG